LIHLLNHRVAEGKIAPRVEQGHEVAARTSVALALVVLVASAAAQEPLPRPDPSLPDLGAALARTGLDGERRVRLEQALREGAYDRAEALLVEAVEREPGSPELLRLLGGVFFVRGRALNAAVALKKAEALAPLDERSRFTLAMAYVILGRREWARPELDKLVEAAPRDARYVYWTARLDYDQGQYATAVKSLLRAIELDARFVKAHDNLGLCYDALGRFEEAIRSYEEAVRLNREAVPSSPWPPLNLGLALSRLDRLDEVEPLFRESLRADPGFAQGHYQLGVVLEKKGRPADALRELEEAARLDPRYPEPLYALARLYRREGDPEKADRALELFQKLKKEKGQVGSGR
jgi:tetratricopeptide (TPR) repeat protein